MTFTEPDTKKSMKFRTTAGTVIAVGALALAGCTSAQGTDVEPAATVAEKPDAAVAYIDIDGGLAEISKADRDWAAHYIADGEPEYAVRPITGNSVSHYASEDRSSILDYVSEHPELAPAVAKAEAQIEKEKAEAKARAAKKRAEKKAKAEARAAARAERLRHKEIDSRQISLIVKDPDAHEGDRVIVYGEINQFDAATGANIFLGDVASYNTTSYGYFDGENSMFVGTKKMLKNFVEGDVFRANVQVGGSHSYDTQVGGNTTVPIFSIQSIERIGNNG